MKRFVRGGDAEPGSKDRTAAAEVCPGGLGKAAQAARGTVLRATRGSGRARGEASVIGQRR
eukprot:3068380-Alexandrium_andersonii.AAC.1